MKFTNTYRSILLAGSALALLSACGEADVASLGDSGPVTIGGGGAGGPVGADFDFIPATGCPTGTESRTGISAQNGSTIDACALVGGTIQSNVSLPQGTYAIDGAVFVGNDNANSATLQLAAGTTLFGASGNDYIVISRGSQIDAQGTAASPIVMTSANDLADGSVNDGSSNGNADAFGEWGGLVISGNAPINDCTDTSAVGGTVGCVKSGEGNSGLFGGADVSDNSGIMRYVRVQFAGFRVNDEDELNGIAFQGVGNAGTFEFLQIHNNLDDGVEFFGGTANVKNLIVTGAGDDSIDWTDGWTGNVQFAVVQQSEFRGDRGIEADNRNGDNDITPRSNPNIVNFTFLGGAAGDTGMVLRRGTAGDYVNGVITGFQDAAIDIDDQATFDQLQADNLRFFSLLLAGNNENIESGDEVDTTGDGSSDAPDGFAAGTQAQFDTAGRNNVEAAGSTLDGVFPGPTENAVTATDPTGFDPFLMAANYIGAFAPGTTANSATNWAAGWSIGLPFDQAAGCPTGTVQTNTAVPAGRTEARVCLLSASGSVTQDITLTRGNLYQLEGAVFFGNDNADSVDLTIDPGVTIFGSTGNDYIVISRGSRLFSNGTAQAPVVMTSRADVEGTVDPVNDFGQWGGLVISGNAPINDCTDTSATGGTVACVKSGEGNSGLFGGADANDDSGDITFTRIQYAGFRVNDEDELNGIAFQGVGDAGNYDYIQIHNNLDDGLEWFGGTANASHVVITGAGDDSLDWTDGWVGNVQYAIVAQTRAGAGDRGIEGDNRNGDNDILPRSAPSLSNFTFVGGWQDLGFGAGFGDVGILPRRGSAGIFANGILTNWADAAIDVDDAATAAQLGTGLQFLSLYTVDNNETIEDGNEIDTSGDGSSDTPDGLAPATQAEFDAAGGNNVDGDALAQSSTLTVGADDTGITMPLVPGVNESAVTPTDPATIDLFFGPGSYVGAVENDADNWYVGWTFGL